MSEQTNRWQKRIVLTLPGWLAAVAAGAAADFASIPLAWILGPLIATAVFSIGGLPPIAPVEFRRSGQLVVGSAIGLNMTTEAAMRLPAWLPAMILAAILSIILSGFLSIAVARFAKVDRATAYFATLPGGLSEMANVGSGFGARAEAVSLSHAMRVALAVLLVPALVVAIDFHEVNRLADDRQISSPQIIVLLGLGGYVGMRLLRFVGLANTWMLGALAVSGVLAGSGLVDTRLPEPLVWLGQFLIGISIGIRFKRDIIRQLPLFGIVSALATILLGALLIGVAWLAHLASNADFPVLILALSPGGFAEMTLTARALTLDIALVTGFHFVRAFCVNSMAGPLWARVFSGARSNHPPNDG